MYISLPCNVRRRLKIQWPRDLYSNKKNNNNKKNNRPRLIFVDFCLPRIYMLPPVNKLVLSLPIVLIVLHRF